ncbi:MAG: hypothetical protein C4329_13120 [Chitinophagaceae bacterium]
MRKTLLLLLLILASSFSFAQFRLGLFGGIANYAGDLVDQPYIGKLTKQAFGLTGTYEFTDRIAVRASFIHGQVAGDDRYNKKDYLKLRNLNFTSNIDEFSVLAEINTFSLYEKRWTPYVFVGLGLYHFNPYTTDSAGSRVYLKPLSTEGQGIQGYATKPYNLTQLALPFGGGVKFAINDRIQLGLEVGIRKLFTDYLDDVSNNYADPSDLLRERGQQAVDLSYRADEVPGGDPKYPSKGAQRGSAKNLDWYYFTGLHLTFALGGGRSRTYAGEIYGNKKQYNCPKLKQ